MRRGTRLTHLGRKAKSDPQLVNLPVSRASTVCFDTVAEMEHLRDGFDAGEPIPIYAMANMPLQRAFEELIVDLEGGHRAVTLPSGQTAVALAILTCVKAGDHLLITDSCYGPARGFCDRTLKRFGVETTYYDPAIGAGIEALMKPNTKAVFLESPGSVTFEVPDFPAMAKAAHARGAAVIQDNSWGTGFFFRSFDHGADLVVQAVTKYLAGHADLLMGAVIANEKWWPRLRDTARDLGQTTSPDDIYQAIRGMRTMEVRLRHQEKAALRIARDLEKHPAVKRVLHPAIETHPGHAFWKRDFTGSSGLFSIEMKTRDEAALARFLDALEFFALGYSYGGYESLASLGQLDRHGRSAVPWTGNPLVRLNIGLEDPDDLLEDLHRGLALI
jgi:cystathionine beta-lyase